jgi:hypothetical protein
MYHPFSIGETVKGAWNILKKNFVPLVVYSAISLFINEFFQFLNTFIFVGDDRVTVLSTFFLQLIIQSFLALSFYKLILTLMDKEYYEFEFKEIVPSFKMTLNFILIAIGYGLLIALLLFINLVIERNIAQYDTILMIFRIVESCLILYLLLRSIFCACFIVDDDSSPFESLRQSFEATKDNFFKTLAVFLIIVGVAIAGVLVMYIIEDIFGVNEEDNPYLTKLLFYCWVIFAFPIIQVLIIVTYRRLVYSHKDVDDDDFLETN